MIISMSNEIWAVSLLYAQEILNLDTKDKMYAKLNVKGLKEAHDDGWVKEKVRLSLFMMKANMEFKLWTQYSMLLLLQMLFI